MYKKLYKIFENPLSKGFNDTINIPVWNMGAVLG